MKHIHTLMTVALCTAISIGSLLFPAQSQENTPITIVKAASDIGAITEVIYADDKQMAVIDMWDERHFLSIIERENDSFTVKKRFYLSDQVTAFSYFTQANTGHLITVLGMNTGLVKLFDLTTFTHLKDVDISETKIDTAQLQVQESTINDKLLVSSNDTLSIIDLSDNYDVTSYPVGTGGMVQGSFTQANIPELLFGDGSVYRFTASAALSKVAQLSSEQFKGEPIYAQDFDEDGVDEVLLKTTQSDYDGHYEENGLALFSVKHNRNIWDGNNTAYPFIRENFRSFLMGDIPQVVITPNSIGSLETRYMSYSYCIVTIELELQAPNCYTHPEAGYRYDEVVFVHDFNQDGKLDIFESGISPHNVAHNLYTNVEGEGSWLTAEFPEPDARCANSRENKLVDFEGRPALECTSENEFPSAMSGNFKDTIYTRTIDLKTNKQLKESYLADVTSSYFCSRTLFYDDVNLDGLDDEFNYYYCGRGDPSDYSDYNQISVYDGASDYKTFNHVELKDIDKRKANKLVYSSKEGAVYLLYPPATWIVGAEEGPKQIDNGVQFVDIASASYKGFTSVFGLSQDGALYVLDEPGLHKKINQLCGANNPISLNDVAVNKLVFSCENGFGVYNTINESQEFWFDTPLNYQHVFFQSLGEQGYFYTDGSDPVVFQYLEQAQASEEVVGKSLSVHVRSALDIDLAQWFSGEHYVFDHQSNKAQLAAKDLNHGVYQYTPSQIGKDYLSYKVLSNNKQVAHGSVRIEIYNTAPVAKAIEQQVHWRGVSELQLLGEDEDQDTISYEIIEQPQEGSLFDLDSSTGVVHFNPEASMSESLSFSYRVADANDTSEPAVVKLQLTNSAPVAQDMQLSAKPSQTLSFSLKVSETDGDPLTYHLAQNVSSKRIVLNEATGKVTVSIPSGASEDMSFGFYVSDGRDESEVKTVNIKIAPSNNSQSGSSGSFDPRLIGILLVLFAIVRRVNAVTKN